MKIGILTYHRAHNFGAILQALATLCVVQKLGHDVFFVDYWPDYHRRRYILKKPSILLSIAKPHRLLKYLRTKGNKIARINKYFSFINIYVAPFCRNIDEEYDAVLYGSDQIWRKQKELNGFNSMYFASRDINAKKYIAFSASTDRLPSEEDKVEFKNLLTNFDAISVREEQLLKYCNSLGLQTEQVLDPTFLLSSLEWCNYLNIQKTGEAPYALFYIMKQGVFDINVIRKFCSKRGLRLKILHGYSIDKDDKENISIADPRDFINLIYNAEVVFTSSFHGLAFAINMEKEFYVSTDFGVDRIKSLLDTFELGDRFVDGKSPIGEFAPIDYNKVNIVKSDKIEKTKSFLLKNCTF